MYPAPGQQRQTARTHSRAPGKTPDGKAAVRLNALRHGLLWEEIVLPGEDEETLRELTEGLRAEPQPGR